MNSSKKSNAGKASGISRANLARVRRFWVLSAFERLKPKYQAQPWSSESIDALENEFRSPKVFNLPQLEPPLLHYESVVDPKARVPSEKLMAMIDDGLIDLLKKGVPESVRQASRDTLIKDLQALEIRSKKRKQQSG